MAGKPVCHNAQGAEPTLRGRIGARVAAYGGLPLPADLNWLWTVGAILCAILALMLLSGLTLTLAYTPDAGLAFGSVEAIERRMPAGWLLRAMHMTGASFFMLALYVHLLRGLYYRSYQPPRRAVWMSGCVLLVMVMVTAFAGYVLPWGQMSYWGADVAGKAVGALPLVGGWLEGLFLGGDSPGTPTLHRMFALHFGLAFLIVGMAAGHIACVHARGSSSPSAATGPGRGMLPFHPYFTVRDMLAIVLVALAFVGVMGLWPDLIAEPANYRPANPLHTPTDIEPEWYFLPFYGMMQAVPFKLGGLLLSGGAVAVLFAVPWLDPARQAGRYPPVLARVGAMVVLVGSAVATACAGLHHMQGGWLLVARLGMVGYYAYFLAFLPLSGRLGRRRGV